MALLGCQPIFILPISRYGPFSLKMLVAAKDMDGIVELAKNIVDAAQLQGATWVFCFFCFLGLLPSLLQPVHPPNPSPFSPHYFP